MKKIYSLTVSAYDVIKGTNDSTAVEPKIKKFHDPTLSVKDNFFLRRFPSIRSGPKRPNQANKLIKSENKQRNVINKTLNNKRRRKNLNYVLSQYKR